MSIDFPNSPATGDFFTSGAQGWRWDGTKWTSGTQGPTGVRGDGVNILRRNGGFEVWQRGAGGSAVFNVPASASAFYTADGWYMSVGANQAYTVSQIAALVPQSYYAGKVQRNAGQTGVVENWFGFPMDFDEIAPAVGNYVRLSFVAKAGANWSPASGILTATLTVGTAAPSRLGPFTSPTIVLTTSVNLTTTATRYQASSSIILPLTTWQSEVTFKWTPVGTAGADDSFFIDDVQLEIVPAATGYVASPFQRLNFEEQLALCQRHYQKTFRYNTAPGVVGFDTGELHFLASKAGAVAMQLLGARIAPPMRVIPALGTYTPTVASTQVVDEIAGALCSGLGTAGITESAFRLLTLGNATTAVGNILGLHVTMDAGI